MSLQLHWLLQRDGVITAELFQKNGCDLNAYNNVRDILYNTDVFTNIVRSIVGKLV